MIPLLTLVLLLHLATTPVEPRIVRTQQVRSIACAQAAQGRLGPSKGRGRRGVAGGAQRVHRVTLWSRYID